MPEHQLVQDPFADAAVLRDLERAGANFVHVLERGVGTQKREIATAGPRRLHRVVHVDHVWTQHRPLAEPVDEPQVLERRDVPEVPDQRAHQRRVHPLEVLVRDGRDQSHGPLARLVERPEDLHVAGRGPGPRGRRGAVHPSHSDIRETRGCERSGQGRLWQLVAEVQGTVVLELPDDLHRL